MEFQEAKSGVRGAESGGHGMPEPQNPGFMEEESRQMELAHPVCQE